MDNNGRARFLTSNYFALQGLRFTPVWLFLAFRPWLQGVPNHRPTYVRDWLILTLLLLCGAWIGFAGKLYRRRYGTVHANPWPWWQWLFIVAVIAGYLACYHADYKNASVSFTAIWWGIFIGARAMGRHGSEIRRVAYALAGSCMLLLALVPLTGRISSSELLDVDHPYGVVLLGALMVTLGIIDHFELVRLISPQSRGTHA